MAAYTTLIEPGELAALDAVMIFDCSFVLTDPGAGKAIHAASHIPEARHVDLEADLSGEIVQGQTGRHPLPERQAFLACVRAWGITGAEQIVAYDQRSGAHAARLWWMLRWLGHANVAVLNGGFTAWRAESRSVTNDISSAPPAYEFSAGEPLTREVAATSLPATGQTVLDAREHQRFIGAVEPIDPVAGHIPGARCAAFDDNLDAEGRFRSASELADRFRGLGAGYDADTICYCGSGVTAAHNILAMRHAGLPEPALYPGSWSEWIVDPARPIATGE